MPTLAELDAAMLRPGRMAPAVNRLGGGTIAMAGTDQPLRAVGRTAVVYQLRQPSGRVLALRCALTDAADLDPSLGERYRLLGSDPGLAPFRGGGGPLTGDITYVAEGLSLPAADLRSVSHPIMAMEWVMGPTLLTATDRACRASDRTYLDDLAAALVSALTALRAAGFSHGNLAADNILVRPGGGLALVDYDTSAWPGAPRGTGLLSQPAALPGLGYAHPSGVPAPLQQRDDFPALVLYASLRVLARLPSLRQEHGDAPGRAGGVLLFNERDLREPDRSPTFGALRVLDDPPLKFLVDTLRHACHQRVAEVPAFPEVIARMDYLAVQTPSVRPAAPPPPPATPDRRTGHAATTTRASARAPPGTRSRGHPAA
jgi:hypothetical protein